MSNDEKIQAIKEFAKQHPDAWERSFGFEGLPTIEDEVDDYFHHYGESMADNVMIDLKMVEP